MTDYEIWWYIGHISKQQNINFYNLMVKKESFIPPYYQSNTRMQLI